MPTVSGASYRLKRHVTDCPLQWQGARLVRQSGLRAVFVFIAPPNLEELEKRLRGRGTESEEQIQVRLRRAEEELAR